MLFVSSEGKLPSDCIHLRQHTTGTKPKVQTRAIHTQQHTHRHKQTPVSHQWHQDTLTSTHIGSEQTSDANDRTLQKVQAVKERHWSLLERLLAFPRPPGPASTPLSKRYSQRQRENSNFTHFHSFPSLSVVCQRVDFTVLLLLMRVCSAAALFAAVVAEIHIALTTQDTQILAA